MNKKQRILKFAGAKFYWAVPLLTMALSVGMRVAAGPYWLSTNLDPAYLYLLNSLYYLRGIQSYFTDHPGTTLHMLFVGLFWLTHPGQAAERTIEDVLRNPELYLNVMNIFLIVIFGVSSIFLGRTAYRASGSKTFAVLVQCPAFLLVALKAYVADIVLPIMANVNAEPLMATVMNVLFILALKIYKDPAKGTTLVYALWFALVCAAGIATKFTFAPLIVLPLFFLKGLRTRIVFLGALGTGLLFFLLPISGRLPQVGTWLGLVFFSIGAPQGMKPDGYLDGLIWLGWEQTFIVLIVLALLAGYLISLRKKPYDKAHVFAGAGLLAVMLNLLVVAKHHGPQYLVVGIGSAGMTAAFLYLLLARSLEQRKLGGQIALLLIILGTVHALFYGVQLAKRTAGRLTFDAEIRRKYADCKIVSFYRSSGLEYALQFGDGTRGARVMGDVLEKLYPGQYFFYPFAYQCGGWTRDILLSNIQKNGACVVFRGVCQYDFDRGPYRTERAEAIPEECVFRLISSTEDKAAAYRFMALLALKKNNIPKAYKAVKLAFDHRSYPDPIKPLLAQICPRLEGKDIYGLCGK